MIIHSVPRLSYLLLSNGEEKVALIKLELGANDITDQLELAIKEHFDLEAISIKGERLYYDFLYGMSTRFEAELFADGENWTDLFTLEHLEVY